MVRMQYEMSLHIDKVLTNFLISIFAENSDFLFFIMDGVLFQAFAPSLMLHAFRLSEPETSFSLPVAPDLRPI